MNEFELISHYFKTLLKESPGGLKIGIGDDTAVFNTQPGYDTLISCDTLVSNVHFHDNWDPFDIAYKAIMVNVSDVVAMGGIPTFALLALTLPHNDTAWLDRYCEGLKKALHLNKLHLIGGDLTKGPLSMTITVLGEVKQGKVCLRSHAKVGDVIFVSGMLGGAALALKVDSYQLPEEAKISIHEKLKHPRARLDFVPYLQEYANACIDISDGLIADLNHICQSSHVGALLELEAIPCHPLVKEYAAIDLALYGGDDYELCFTVAKEKVNKLMHALALNQITCYPIGEIEAVPGLRYTSMHGIQDFNIKGFQHF